MEYFKAPENKMIGRGHLLKRHRTHLAFEILLVIQYEDPENVQQGVEEPEIQVLVFMQTIFLLVALIRIQGCISMSSSTPSTLVKAW